jgi:hypothetical protein
MLPEGNASLHTILFLVKVTKTDTLTVIQPRLAGRSPHVPYVTFHYIMIVLSHRDLAHQIIMA